MILSLHQEGSIIENGDRLREGHAVPPSIVSGLDGIPREPDAHPVRNSVTIYSEEQARRAPEGRSSRAVLLDLEPIDLKNFVSMFSFSLSRPIWSCGQPESGRSRSEPPMAFGRVTSVRAGARSRA